LEGAIRHLQEVLHLDRLTGYQRKAAVRWLQREVLNGKGQKRRAKDDNVRVYS